MFAPARIARLAALLVALLLAASSLALAQAPNTYRTPPSPVGDILNAPRLPRGAPSVTEDGARMVLPDLPSLVPIASLAEPVEKLAGLEILPGMRVNRAAIKFAANGMRIVTTATGASVRVNLPAGSRILGTEWSNDGKHVAIATMAQGGADLWIVDASGTPRKIDGVKLNGVFGARMEWSNDDQSLWCAAVPNGQKAPEEASRVPDGPQVRVGTGRAAAQRTSRDVLRTPSDQERFNYYVSSQIVRVPVAGGAPQTIGAPAMLFGWGIAPDEKHLLVERIAETLPMGFPFYLFPVRVEVWNADGTVAATVGNRPLNDRSAISSVADLGPREAGFSANGQAIYFFSWQDTPGADAQKAIKDTTLAQPGTDRLMKLAAPFTGEAQVVATSADMQYVDWSVIGDSERLMLWSGYAPRRMERVSWVDLAHADKPTLLTTRSTEGVYDDPGAIQRRKWSHNSRVWTTKDGKSAYRTGAGFRAGGQRPFLDRVDLSTAKTTRLFESDADHLEAASVVLDADAKRFITGRESNREPRNFWLRTLGAKNAVQLSDFKDPAPALSQSQRIQFQFTRPDNVKLNAEAVLPADWKPGKALPTVFWIYPNDYRSAAAASENRRSPNRFPLQSPLNPEVLVTQGYCVVYPDIAVVGTNDNYVAEIRKSAQAAVDECVKRGYTDRNRIGVGGHSYGAFSTANMLAHTDLFKAGVASDGAYNRTLTPFTFQAEERNLWQATDTYLAMSPFVHADDINEPLLLMHNLDDTNVGTNPIQSDRMYEALNGLGKTVTLVNYPYEDHGPAAKETVLDYWSRAIEWYDKYVKNAAAASAPTASGDARP